MQAVAQTVEVATSQGILAEEPSDDSYTDDIARAALDGLDGDTTGDGFAKRTDIVLEEGGA